MAKKKRQTLVAKIKSQSKARKIAFIAIFAIIAAAIIGNIFAAMPDKNDYSLDTPTEQVIVSFEEEKPLIVTKGSNGQVRYISRGKSVNVSASGKVYCTPNDDGPVTTKNISEKTMNSVVKSVQSSIEPSRDSANSKYSTPTIGNNSQVVVNSGDAKETLTTKNSSKSQKAREVLLNLCKDASDKVDPSSVPTFQTETVISSKNRQSRAPLLVSKAYAADNTKPVVTSPNLNLVGLSNHQQVKGSVKLEAQPIDISGVASISFFIDNQLINTDSTSRYCLFATKSDNTCADFSIYNLSNGYHTVRADMRLNTSQIITSSLNINVQNPVPGLLYPDENSEANQYWNINNARLNNGQAPLSRSNCLDKAARKWAQNMATQDRLYHSNIQAIVEAECGSGWWAMLGENVGVGGESESIFQAFMNSPGHRANVLRPNYQRAGVGAFRYTLPGTNQEKLWVSQLFVQCQGSCANK